MNRLCAVFEFDVGMIDNGAPIDFLSQYPGEDEVLFPPRSCLEVIGEQRLEMTPVGEVIVVPARINSNQKTETIESIQGKRKHLHMQVLKNTIDEVYRDLGVLVNSSEFEERAQADISAVHSSAEMYLLREIHMECLEWLSRDENKDPAWFNDDDNFKSAVRQGVELKGMALNKFLAWLRNDNVLAANLIYDRFREVKRTSLSKLQKDFMRAKASADTEETARLALKLCKEKGLVRNSVEEINELLETPLIAAATEGNLLGLELLIDARADINGSDEVQEQSAVEAAVAAGETKCLHALIKAGAKVEERAVILACDRGHIDCLQELLKKVPFDSSSEKVIGARLAASAEGGHHQCLEELFHSGAEIPEGEAGAELVLKACLGGSSQCAMMLLEKGANVNGLNSEDGTSPLMTAAMMGNVELVKLLLEKGADTELKAEDGSEATALAFAALRGYDDVVKALLEAQASPSWVDPRDGETLLFSVAQTGNAEIVKKLIAAGADPNEECQDGHTPLMGAALGSASVLRQDGRLETIKVLLEANADPNASVTYDSRTVPAWLHCIRQNDTEALELCIDKGANLGWLKDRMEGGEVMGLVASYGNLSMLKLLLQAEVPADGGVDSIEGELRPVMIAALLGHAPLVEELLDRGAQVDLPGRGGLRLLSCALRSSSLDALNVILSRNPELDFEVEIQEGVKVTPVIEAVLGVMQGSGRDEILKALLDKGAKVDTVVEGMNKQNAVMIAAQAGLHSTVSVLLDSAPPGTIDAQDGSGKTAFQLAKERGQFKCAEVLAARAT